MVKILDSLIKDIENELEEDLNRFDGDWNEWSESVLDTPSKTLVKLLTEAAKFPGFEDVFVNKIDLKIESLRPDEDAE
jgi:hypothetical protein